MKTAQIKKVCTLLCYCILSAALLAQNDSIILNAPDTLGLDISIGSGRPDRVAPVRSDTRLMQNEQVVPGTFSFLMDQDFLFRFPFELNEDRNYTQGTALVYSHPDLNHFILFWPQKLIGKYSRQLNHASSSVGIGGTAFTPRIIDSSAPIVGDRPFAFLLYLSTSSTFIRTRLTVDRHGHAKQFDIYNTFSINYGMFGTNLGFEFQSFAHKNIVPGRPENPKGWNTQISKGGCPTLLIEYNRFRPLPALRIKHKEPERSLLDIGWNLTGSIGYYDRLASGLYARAGLLKKTNQARWNGGFSSLNSASYQKVLADSAFNGMAEPLKRSNRFKLSEFFFVWKI